MLISSVVDGWAAGRSCSRVRCHGAGGAVWCRLFALVLILGAGPSAWSTGDPVVICHGSQAAALVPLAKLEDRFQAEGLNVTLRHYPSGFQALQAMLDGDCALATAAVPPVVYQALRRSDFRILAAISTSGDYERIVVRRDRDILSPQDLRGRRIAVASATSAHYFLDMFLAANGLTPGEVTEVYLPADEVGAAFLAGTVDAAAHWEPNIRNLVQASGDRAQVFGFSGLVVSPFLLLARQEFAAQASGSVQGILHALVRAARSLDEAPASAMRLLAPVYQTSVQEVAFIGSLHDYSVTLDQPLPFILENAARWQLGLLPPAERPPMPNFLDLIDASGLRAVKPQAVSLID